jgi:hypothetical protein
LHFVFLADSRGNALTEPINTRVLNAIIAQIKALSPKGLVPNLQLAVHQRLDLVRIEIVSLCRAGRATLATQVIMWPDAKKAKQYTAQRS